MKKLFAVMISAVMMAGALAAFTISPAQAECPYTGCIETFTHVDAKKRVQRTHKGRICVEVTTEGNGRPKGTLFFIVRRSEGRFKFTDLKKYNDAVECIDTPRLYLRGNYTVKVAFERKPGSSFKDSDGYDEFRVVSHTHDHEDH